MKKVTRFQTKKKIKKIEIFILIIISSCFDNGYHNIHFKYLGKILGFVRLSHWFQIMPVCWFCFWFDFLILHFHLF